MLKYFLLLFRPYPYRFGTFLKRHGGYEWDRWKRRIYDTDGTLLYDDADPYPDFTRFVEEHFAPEESRKILAERKARDSFKVRCTHLHESIRNKFNIPEPEPKWRHWNGGVFLFNETAKEFFETWHRFTLEIFSDPYWEKRDQGTLIATVWKQGMQERNPLPEVFNFIADYNSENLKFDPGNGFTRDNFSTYIHPHLVHVYHHFGDKNWPVWKWIESLI